jgi:hypothetical protein
MNKLVIVPALMLSTLANAESLEEKKFWKGQLDYVNESLKSAGDACGVTFTFDWVDKAKLREAAEKTSHTPNGICTAVIDEVGSLCRQGDDEKAAVKAKIKGFKCGFAKPRTLAMTGGIVTYMGNNEEANFSDWARPWLMKKL